VNEEFYANKPACIEPNVEILEFIMKEHDPRGIPDEIQNISDMVEMATPPPPRIGVVLFATAGPLG
jgi:hypothetical protein